MSQHENEEDRELNEFNETEKIIEQECSSK